MSETPPIPESLHIVTYDVRGTIVETGQEKPVRQTGIVSQTHHLINGFVELQPDLELSVTQTGARQPMGYDLQTPEGHVVFAQGLRTGFAEYLGDQTKGGKNKALNCYYYEDTIHDLDNPVLTSLAEQYAGVVRRANTPNILLQNSNAIVGLLKSEELGELDELTLGQLNVTGVIHDIEGYEGRLSYIQERLGRSAMNIKIVAVSEFVRQQLDAFGMPQELLFTVPNGIDVEHFASDLERVRQDDVFADIAARNNLPEDADMILVPARRVEHKGHLDVLQAVKILKDQGKFDGRYVAFTGSNMLNTQSLQFQETLQNTIIELELEDTVFMLDELTEGETIACFDEAYVSVLASTEPEGFAYANIEAMLAGTPVITTQLGGPLDYIRHRETGLFVDVHDPQGIAAALEELGNDQELYQRLTIDGLAEAKTYTLQTMALGYANAIQAGEPRLALAIRPKRAFQKIGEGLHSEVYQRGPNSKFVLQVFKKDRSDLSFGALEQEYLYLQDVYAEMPGLVPSQRILAPRSTDLHSIAILKRAVASHPDRNTLLKVEPDELAPETLEQLARFVEITKQLFTGGAKSPALRELDPRVPDIIDPHFENLLVDLQGNLRLVDTNRLISTKHLKELVASGQKLDLERRRIHGKLLQRMMFIESKFFGATEDSLRKDYFYNQYLSPEGFDQLFEQARQAGEIVARDQASTRH